MRADLFQDRQAALVALDRNHACRAFEQQCACQTAGAGADFDDRAVRHVPAGTRDLAGAVEVEKKVLAQALLGAQLVGVDDLAQRRQAVRARTGADRHGRILCAGALAPRRHLIGELQRGNEARRVG